MHCCPRIYAIVNLAGRHQGLLVGVHTLHICSRVRLRGVEHVAPGYVPSAEEIENDTTLRLRHIGCGAARAISIRKYAEFLGAGDEESTLWMSTLALARLLAGLW